MLVEFICKINIAAPKMIALDFSMSQFIAYRDRPRTAKHLDGNWGAKGGGDVEMKREQKAVSAGGERMWLNCRSVSF